MPRSPDRPHHSNSAVEITASLQFFSCIVRRRVRLTEVPAVECVTVVKLSENFVIL